MKKHRPDWKPKLNIQITKEQSKELKCLVPYGVRTRLFNLIIDDLIALCRSGGGVTVSAILAGKLGNPGRMGRHPAALFVTPQSRHAHRRAGRSVGTG